MTSGATRQSSGITASGVTTPQHASTSRQQRWSARGRWQLVVDTDARAGADNMALDWTLLRAAQDGIASLRLYRWSPPCLSFGRNEPATSRYDRDRIAALGLDTVRRPTGGRAVWHEHEVTYAVSAPSALFGSLHEAYISIHGMLATALQRLGVPAKLAPRSHHRSVGPGGGACFAQPVGGEIVVGGRKLVGSAQVREGEALLQHGSILLEDGQDVVSQVIRGVAEPPTATGLSALLGRRVAFTEVARVIAETAYDAWGTVWTRAQPEPLEDATTRFRDPTWTWRR